MKSSFLLASVLLLATVSHAQTGMEGAGGQTVGKTQYSSDSSVRLIPHAGIMNSKIVTKDDNSDFTPGFTGGMLADFGSGTFAFETGLQYMQQGGEESSDGFKISVTFDYLAIPLFAKLNVSGDPSSSFFVKGGLIPAIKVDETWKAEYGGSKVSIDADQARDFDTMAALGMGGAIPIGQQSLVLETVVNYSLLNISKDDDRAHNLGILLSAGFSFDL